MSGMPEGTTTDYGIDLKAIAQQEIRNGIAQARQAEVDRLVADINQSRIDSTRKRHIGESVALASAMVLPVKTIATMAVGAAYELYRYSRRVAGSEAKATQLKANPDVKKQGNEWRVIKQDNQDSEFPNVTEQIDSSAIRRRARRRSGVRVAVAATALVGHNYISPTDIFNSGESESAVAAPATEPLDPLGSFNCTLEPGLTLQTAEQFEQSAETERTSNKALQKVLQITFPEDGDEPLYSGPIDGWHGVDTHDAYSELEPIIYRIFDDDQATTQFSDVRVDGVVDGVYECAFVTGVLESGYNVADIRNNPAIASLGR